jgi:curved DNA-binding protein
MGYKDYYTILGIQRSASQDEIQKAYRKLARKYHPDVNKTAGAEERFKELGEAYGVLKDEKKRSLYDRYGNDWKAVSEGRAPPSGANRVNFDFRGAGFDPGQFSDLGSLFDSIFGVDFSNPGKRRRRTPGRGKWPQGGQDQEVNLELTLEEGSQGGERSIHLTEAHSGAKRSFTLRIPPGVKDGQRIRLAGQGTKGAWGGPSGDLYLRVRLLPHPVFKLDGSDLRLTLPVTPWEAALGAEVEVPTLDGKVRVKVPPGSSSGRKIRLKGKGYHQSGKSQGDFYIELSIAVPKKLTDDEKKLLTNLAEISNFNPRA